MLELLNWRWTTSTTKAKTGLAQSGRLWWGLSNARTGSLGVYLPLVSRFRLSFVVIQPTCCSEKAIVSTRDPLVLFSTLASPQKCRRLNQSVTCRLIHRVPARQRRRNRRKHLSETSHTKPYVQDTTATTRQKATQIMLRTLTQTKMRKKRRIRGQRERTLPGWLAACRKSSKL